MTLGEPAAEPDERGHRRGAAGRAAVAGRHAGWSRPRAAGRQAAAGRAASTSAPATPGSCSPRARRWRRSRRAGWSPPSWWRPAGCSPAPSPGSTRRSSSGWPTTWSSGSTREPRWDAKRGSVVATERVTLYGLPLVVGRRVQYGSIDPVVSRELFIRHALVQGEWTTHHRFWADNQRAIEQVAELEERARRRDIRVDDETLFELYDARIPADVVSTRHFDRWWKQARRETAGPAHLHAGDAHRRRGGRAGAAPRTIPDEVAPDPGADPAAVLRVRARRRRGRRHRRRAAGRARPVAAADVGGVAGLHRAGAARGAGHRAAAHAAQAAAPRRWCPSPTGCARCCRTSTPASRCCPRWSASCAARPPWSSRRTPGSRPRCPTTCGPPSGCSTTSSARWPGQGPRRAARRRWRRRRGPAWPRAAVASSAPG